MGLLYYSTTQFFCMATRSYTIFYSATQYFYMATQGHTIHLCSTAQCATRYFDFTVLLHEGSVKATGVMALHDGWLLGSYRCGKVIVGYVKLDAEKLVV